MDRTEVPWYRYFVWSKKGSFSSGSWLSNWKQTTQRIQWDKEIMKGTEILFIAAMCQEWFQLAYMPHLRDAYSNPWSRIIENGEIIFPFFVSSCIMKREVQNCSITTYQENVFTYFILSSYLSLGHECLPSSRQTYPSAGTQWRYLPSQIPRYESPAGHVAGFRSLDRVYTVPGMCPGKHSTGLISVSMPIPDHLCNRL